MMKMDDHGGDNEVWVVAAGGSGFGTSLNKDYKHHHHTSYISSYISSHIIITHHAYHHRHHRHHRHQHHHLISGKSHLGEPVLRSVGRSVVISSTNARASGDDDMMETTWKQHGQCVSSCRWQQTAGALVF